MSMLTELHPELEVRAEDMYSGKGSPPAPPVISLDLQLLLERFPNAPQEYIDLIKIHDGITFIEEEVDSSC